MRNHLDARHMSMVLVDVERFGDPTRTDNDHLKVRHGFYSALSSAFAAARIRWADCAVQDLGDGAMVLVPPTVSKNQLVALLPGRLLHALRQYNEGSEPTSRARLRLALHAGEVHVDGHGFTGDALTYAFRLLDSPAAKAALREADGDLLVIVSQELYRTVVLHDPAARPTEFRSIDCRLKETTAVAWIRLPSDDEAAALTTVPQSAMLAASAPSDIVDHEPEDQLNQVLVADRRRPRRSTFGLAALVDALLQFPMMASESGRRLLMDSLRPEVANAVPYHPQARLHVFSLVNTCMRYDYGIEELLDTVRQLADDDPAVRTLDATVAALLARTRHGDWD
jgi:hypothetical protein